MILSTYRSPLAPLKKGGTGIKVPLFKGDLERFATDKRTFQTTSLAKAQRRKDKRVFRKLEGIPSLKFKIDGMSFKIGRDSAIYFLLLPELADCCLVPVE